MTNYPKRGQGRSPRKPRGSSGGGHKGCSEKRTLLKARIQALEARYATLHALILDIREESTGQRFTVHTDDMETAEEE